MAKIENPEPLVAPSILAGDHANLASSAAVIAAAGLKWVHLDIMDGHFVPNLTFGPQTVAALRPNSSLYFDVHLMLDNPHLYVEAFAKAGAQNITIHIEPDYPVAETLQRIRALGCACGICLNPGTEFEAIVPHLKSVDLVLLMTVQPGFGGQKFRSEVLPKIEKVAQYRAAHGLSYRIEIDGGVDEKTGPQCRAAGAETLVAGTAFFRAADKAAFVKTVLG